MEFEEIKKEFVNFLAKNNAYRQYMHNLAYVKEGSYSWDKFAETTHPLDFFCSGFMWHLSEEGHEIWAELHYEWMKYYAKNIEKMLDNNN